MEVPYWDFLIGFERVLQDKKFVLRNILKAIDVLENRYTAYMWNLPNAICLELEPSCKLPEACKPWQMLFWEMHS
ncbi:hypothetical protein MU1_39810 [Paenibacillus glycanilyticus]|uniref:Uncharacterized protein n=1 Tax=Paenibacillus glycanilyticus TaxID=126569 RepID=A0ABQ6GJ44_9BACL|nr:hypothetical protein MU1_39810 [Paenibacillus glycanilyticus]